VQLRFFYAPVIFKYDAFFSPVRLTLYLMITYDFKNFACGFPLMSITCIDGRPHYFKQTQLWVKETQQWK